MTRITRSAALGVAMALACATAACANGEQNQAEGAAKVQQGQVEQGVGNAVGNPSLANQGLQNQAAGHAQGAWGNVQQGAGQAWQATKEGATSAWQGTKNTVNRLSQ